jgi:hypothetical protein
MLKTISRFSSSLVALLGDERSTVDANNQLNRIRTTMLSAAVDFIGKDNDSYWSGKVSADISRAHDIQTLWYLRSDLMRILSDHCGEQVGQKKLDEITEMFRGSVPRDQMPGPRRAGR